MKVGCVMGRFSIWPSTANFAAVPLPNELKSEAERPVRNRIGPLSTSAATRPICGRSTRIATIQKRPFIQLVPNVTTVVVSGHAQGRVQLPIGIWLIRSRLLSNASITTNPRAVVPENIKSRSRSRYSLVPGTLKAQPKSRNDRPTANATIGAKEAIAWREMMFRTGYIAGTPTIIAPGKVPINVNSQNSGNASCRGGYR